MLNFLSLLFMLPQVTDEPGEPEPKRRAVEVVEETNNEETETARNQTRPRGRLPPRTDLSGPLSYDVQKNIIKYMRTSKICDVSEISEEFLRIAKKSGNVELHTVEFLYEGEVIFHFKDERVELELHSLHFEMIEMAKEIRTAKRLLPDESTTVLKFVAEVSNLPILMHYIMAVGNKDVDALVIQNPTANTANYTERIAKMLGPMKYLQVSKLFSMRHIRLLCAPPKELVFEVCSLDMYDFLQLKSPKIVVHAHNMVNLDRIVTSWLQGGFKELVELKINTGRSEKAIENKLKTRTERRESQRIEHGGIVIIGNYYVRADSANVFVGFDSGKNMHVLVNHKRNGQSQ